MMKKVLSLFIAVMMLFALCAGSAAAANGPMPTSPEGWGGARVGLSSLKSPDVAYVVNDLGNGLVTDNNAFAGASYDAASNTLTLTDVDAANCSLFICYMGDDFTIKVEGDCKVGVIYVNNQFDVYNTNLNITGDGSLTINESRENEAAIWMFADGESNCMKLSVDDTVTLHLYAPEEGQPIINLYGTTAESADGAISVGGKGIDGVVGERIVRTDYDEVNAMVVTDRVGEQTLYQTYAAKSKADPDGKYSVTYYTETGSRYVRRYVYLNSIGLWVADQSFGDYGDEKSYSKTAFEEEYTIEQSAQPAKIRYTTDTAVQERGYLGVMLTKAGEPDAVYCGSPIWGSPGSSADDPDSYGVYRVTWSEEEGRYLDDPDFYTSVDAEDMESEGFGFVYETVTRDKHFFCHSDPAPFDASSGLSRYLQIDCKSDPDGIYVKIGDSYYTDVQGNRTDESIIVRKVLLDAESGEYYLSDSDSDKVYVPLEEIGDNYSYMTETVTIKKEIRHIRADYTFDDYSYDAMLAERAGDTAPYCVSTYRSYTGETVYSVHKLELREDGHYYGVKWDPDDSDIYGRSMTIDEFEQKGYSFVMSEQDTPFTLIGNVDFYTLIKYTDAQGNIYGCSWSGDVYDCSQSGVTETFGDEVYYLAVPSDLTPDDLISSEYEIETDGYHYYLYGDEYHHEGAGAEQSVLLGDADMNGKITVLDATAIQRNLAKMETVRFSPEAADVDENGKVSITDATEIQRWLAKLPAHEGIGVKLV